MRQMISAVVGMTMSLLVGCGQPPAAPHEPTMTVSASLFPIGSLAQQLLQGVSDVRTLLPQGQSPHGFELTPARLTQLADADAVLIVGLGLDEWARTAGQNVGAQQRIIAFADLVGLTEEADPHAHHDHGHDHDHDHAHPLGQNPHIWLDPVLTRQYITALAPRLAELYPEHQTVIAANADRLLADLDALDQEYRQALSSVPLKRLVTFHDAFNRLAERYGLEVVATLAPLDLSPGGEIPPRRLADAIDQIRQHGLPVVYSEPQFPSDAAERIAAATGSQVLTLDPLGSPGSPGYDSYQTMMRSNLQTLVRGQSAAP